MKIPTSRRLKIGYPAPLDLIDLEIQTLAFLATDRGIRKHFGELAEKARVAHSYYSSVIKNGRKKTKGGVPVEMQFDFEFDIKIPHHSGNWRQVFHIGERIHATIGRGGQEYRDVSTYIAICKEGECGKPMPVLRKFHFDFDENTMTSPLYHLQFGGKLSPALSQNHDVDGLHPWYSEPRIMTCPMTLAMVIHSILLENRDAASVEVRGRSEWRGLIRRNESAVALPYKEKCLLVLKDEDKNGILSDVFYGT